MLSYRHAFHAGNHADVLKHSVEILLLQHLAQKNTPFWYIDTHAGAGTYTLDSGYATRNAEYQNGIARLWQRDDTPAPLLPYIEHIRALNPDGHLRLYPGSPQCARPWLRPQDRMRLFELHPSDHTLLSQHLAHKHQVKIEKNDGFAQLKALLPPPPRRALILIDPPYEEKRDYSRVVHVLEDALQRFATGVYALWYPQLQRLDSQQLPQRLKKLPVQRWLHVALSVNAPATDGFGMHGSGLFILNPPWTLHEQLAQIMPYLVQHLGEDSRARFVLETQTEPLKTR